MVSNLESAIVITVQKAIQPYLQQNIHINLSYVLVARWETKILEFCWLLLEMISILQIGCQFKGCYKKK